MRSDPKQVVILSGKGGTGKTSVTAALAHLAAQEMVISLADADVDAANLELVLHPTHVEAHDFTGGSVAHIDAEKCISCGNCHTACRFEAILPGDVYRVDPIACEGCAACSYRCPVDAITMQPAADGQWFFSETPYGPLYHAQLFAGGENSGKLVTLVKQQARLRALDDDRPLVLVDGPPGIGCPVISAAAGATLAVLVTEPTHAGIHDLKRVYDLTQHFNVPALVLVNKADLSPARATEIETFCESHDLPLIARLPYDTTVTEAMVQGLPITAYTTAPISEALKEVWETLKTRLF